MYLTNHWHHFAISFALSLFLLKSADSMELRFAWDPNAETDLAGYRIYYKTGFAGEPYNGTGATEGDSPVNVGNATTFTLSGLSDFEDYYFVITAYDHEGLESDYSRELVHRSELEPPSAPPPPDSPPPLAEESLIDNGDPGSSSSGTWLLSSGDNYFGTQSVYSNQSSDTYTFQAAVDGDCEVAMRWTWFNNRCTDVAVEIYNGATLIDTVYVNQLTNAGKWNELGTYDFTDTARVTIISEGNCTTNADALRLLP